MNAIQVVGGFRRQVLFLFVFVGTFSKGQGDHAVFYNDAKYKGNSLELGVSGGCYNLKSSWRDKVSSIQVASDSCIVAWSGENCTAQSIKLLANTTESQALKKMDFDKKIKSINLCTEISFRPILEIGERMWNPTRSIFSGERKEPTSVTRQRVELHFYDAANYKGSILTLVSNGDCYNFKPRWMDRVSSVNSGGRCIIIYDRLNCEGRQAILSSDSAKDFENLNSIGFNNRMKSVKLCRIPIVEVVEQDTKSGKGKELGQDESGNTEKDNQQQNGSEKNRSLDEPRLDTANDAEIRTAALKEHNKLRKLHGVPELKWDYKMQNLSQTHAEWLVTNNKFEHSANDDFGENIAGISSSNKIDALKEAVRLWYNEINNYDFDNPRRSVLEIKAGHFTQIVWKSTTHIGLGVSWNPKRRWYVVVCNYSPPGNYKGAYEKNVFPPMPNEE